MVTGFYKVNKDNWTILFDRDPMDREFTRIDADSEKSIVYEVYCKFCEARGEIPSLEELDEYYQ